jgi:F0F1-type ATP synthase assembly protein I
LANPNFKLPKGDKIRPVLAFSSLGIQIAVVVGGAGYLGRWLDQKYHSTKPWFTVALVLIGVAASMYYVLKQLNEMNDRKP